MRSVPRHGFRKERRSNRDTGALTHGALCSHKPASYPPFTLVPTAARGAGGASLTSSEVRDRSSRAQSRRSQSERHQGTEIQHARPSEPSTPPPPLLPVTPSPSAARCASSAGQRGRTPTSPLPRGRDAGRNLPEPSWSETSLRMSPGCPSMLKQTVSPLAGKSTTKWGSPSAAGAGRAGEEEKEGR